MPARSANGRSQKRVRYWWERLPDEELLDVPLRDLGLKLEDTWLAEMVEQLHEELDARDIRIKPHCWLSEEWFAPDGIPGIGVPFFLAHPRLRKLEHKHMLEVEGGNRRWCMKLLRHEAGHAIQSAYRLQRRKGFRKVFGSVAQKYPDHYRPNPKSRNYVLHLYLWYAQSHPAEDFAETFAVWLTHSSTQWRKRYDGWGALKKLEFVDELMTDVAGHVAPVRSKKRVDSLPNLKKTIREYYEEKQAHYSASYPEVYDRDLRRLFLVPHPDKPKKGEAASRFLRRHRSEIRRMVSHWTGEPEYILEQVLREMIGRCQELKLRATGNERRLKLDFAILLTVRTTQYLYTTREWIPV
ncbi:MAG: putative zinc-binding metallopeptidase [Myxococcota bacterium]